MVMNFNMDIETRLADMYKSLSEPKPAEERKEMSADDFWKSMKMVATNNQAIVQFKNK